MLGQSNAEQLGTHARTYACTHKQAAVSSAKWIQTKSSSQINLIKFWRECFHLLSYTHAHTHARMHVVTIVFVCVKSARRNVSSGRALNSVSAVDLLRAAGQLTVIFAALHTVFAHTYISA